MPISSMQWEAYPWKNELKLQADRTVAHLTEALDDDFDGDHDPLAMLERAITLAAFSMRRMIEKRLITDGLASRKIAVRTFPANAARFRQPFLGRSGGQTYTNYRLDRPTRCELPYKAVADQIIHSSQLMVIGGDEHVADGLLIASDQRLRQRLLHFTAEEFMEHVGAFLGDQVYIASERWDPETNTVIATRE